MQGAGADAVRLRLRLAEGPAEVEVALQGPMRAAADRTEDGRLVLSVDVPGRLHLEVVADPAEADAWLDQLWRPAQETIRALRRPDLRRNRGKSPRE